MVLVRYRTVQQGKSWSVIDANTGNAVIYYDVVLAGLGKRVAKDLAELLNLAHPADPDDTPLRR